MVSGPKTQFMDFAFEQNDYGNGEPVKILGEELKQSYLFHAPRAIIDEGGGLEKEMTECRQPQGKLEKLEEIQLSTV